MQLYRNCDASKNSKLLGAIEMKGIEKNEIIDDQSWKGKTWSGGSINTDNSYDF